jgi:hypothetical protein
MVAKSRSLQVKSVLSSLISIFVIAGCSMISVSNEKPSESEAFENPSSGEMESTPIQIDGNLLQPLRERLTKNKNIVFVQVITTDGEKTIFYPKNIERVDVRKLMGGPVTVIDITSEATFFISKNPCCMGTISGTTKRYWAAFCWPGDELKPEYRTRAQCER